MKRFLLLLFAVMTMSIASNASTIWLKSTSYASANVYNGTYYWGDWQSCVLNIKIDTDDDIIVIYSNRTQVYGVVSSYNNGNSFSDGKGGQQWKFFVIDQDGDRGTVRLRVDREGNRQLYVDFNNVAWVYDVVQQ